MQAPVHRIPDADIWSGEKGEGVLVPLHDLPHLDELKEFIRVGLVTLSAPFLRFIERLDAAGGAIRLTGDDGALHLMVAYVDGQEAFYASRPQLKTRRHQTAERMFREWKRDPKKIEELFPSVDSARLLWICRNHPVVERDPRELKQALFNVMVEGFASAFRWHEKGAFGKESPYFSSILLVFYYSHT
jgi:hypothetical protein